MYGKLFERLYTGSMMGGGAMIFAVWPYVIAHMKPNRDRSVFTVELNTQLMALLIGESEPEIAAVIAKFCEPDPKSRTPDKEGRKLIRLGTYLYEVVNGPVYDEIRREAELRESNRRRQERFYYKNTNGAEALPISPSNPDAVPPKASVARPERPDLEMVKLAASKIGLSEIEGEKFFNYYESNGWKTGKNPIKSWTHALTGWKLRNETNRNDSKPNPRNFGMPSTTAQTSARIVQELRDRGELAS